MKISRFLIGFALLVQFAVGDDGIWLVNEFPRALVKAKYGFEASDEFLKSLRLASTRFNNGGSGSFVSAEGLVITNHHVGSDCIQKLSSKENDYMKNGFMARTRAEEKRCPDLELNVLLKIENVTEQVKGAVPAGASVAEAGKARRAAMSAIEKQCSEKTGHRCDVVTLFSGGQYHLYEYQKYTDIRLVFAPEKDIAFFGGDPDNFTYPRWNLDITFFRVYEGDKPVKPLHYLPWSKEGARQGALQFVSGHPGTTGRLLTVAELETQRDVTLPLQKGRLEALIASLKEFSKKGPEQARVALEEIFGAENSLKAVSGFLGGLQDPALMARKREEEKALRGKIAADADKQKQFGGAWDELAAATAVVRQIYPELNVLESGPASYGSILPIGREVYRLAVERGKPDAERLREFASAGIPSLEESLFSEAPLDRGLEEEIIAAYLRFAVKALGANHAVVREVLGGRSPEAVAAEIAKGTALFDIAERKRLAASAALVEQSTDPLLVLIRKLDPEARRVRKIYEDQVQSPQSLATARIAQAQYALGGNIYPDATFTLRLSFGPATGYKNKAGKAVPWMTDYAGLYRHATGVDPLKLPERWVAGKKKLNLKVPFNYVTTADTHGGNSGSPSVNTKGEFVGILFDGNIEGLPNRYLYTETQARSVHVASQGIIEALRTIYEARELLGELGMAK